MSSLIDTQSCRVFDASPQLPTQPTLHLDNHFARPNPSSIIAITRHNQKMSDVQARPAASRGRGSAARGGRGGFPSRGGRNTARSAATNGDAKHDSEPTSLPTLEDPEVADLEKAYGSKLPIVKELFPDWSDVDILYGLKETDGDEALTVERIADGQ